MKVDWRREENQLKKLIKVEEEMSKSEWHHALADFVIQTNREIENRPNNT